MKLAEYATYDGLGLAELVRKREVTVTDLAMLAMAGMEKVNPTINAIIEVYEDVLDTINEARIFDGPFSGAPFLRKDLGATEEGRLQEMGSRLMKGHICESDSNLWKKFMKAGLINLGRSAVSEFGMLGRTETVLNGITCNPWDPDRTAGGSSGGAAAAVAAGVVPVAHANDAAGSIRIPASCCGLVGLLPSRGRISQGPDRQDAWFGLVREFIVSRTVRDAAYMLDAVQGFEAGDPFEIAPPKRPYASELDAPLGTLRVAFTASPLSKYPVHPDIVEVTMRTVKTLEEMGHGVEEARPPVNFYEYEDALIDAFAFPSEDPAETARQMGRELSTDFLEPATLSLMEFGKSLGVSEMRLILDVFAKVRFSMGRFLAQYDLFVSPTLAQPPIHHTHMFENPKSDWQEGKREDEEWIQYTGLFNITGQPAISLPLGKSKDNLPIGVQLAARFGGEDILLRVASALERAMSWKDSRPPVHVSNT